MPGRKKVLVAEDDSLVRELVRMRLAAAGYDAHTARTGKEVLQRMIVLRPDALILDINMPDMDGFAVLEAIRVEMPDLATPTLIMTARRAPDDVQRAVALGARDYITKDSLETKLLPRLSRMLRVVASEAVNQASAA